MTINPDMLASLIEARKALNTVYGNKDFTPGMQETVASALRSVVKSITAAQASVKTMPPMRKIDQLKALLGRMAEDCTELATDIKGIEDRIAELTIKEK